jgi:NCS1 nucleoside transporter family
MRSSTHNDPLDNVEKGPSRLSLSAHEPVDEVVLADPGQPTGRTASFLKSFEAKIDGWNVERRGINRVVDDDKHRITWFAYVQAFVLWTSVNLAVNNVTLGMLGPAVYELSFQDASICACLGALLGSLPVAWIATWGPLSGLRTMIWSRYAMGWWPSKLIVILNLLQMLGYALIVCIIGGQVLSAVSPNGSMSVVVGVIIVALITWAVTTFGIRVFHYYERFAFIPQLIVYSILYGVSASKFDLTTPSTGEKETVIGNRISFFSLCVSAAITYSPLSMDFFVYYPTTTSRRLLFLTTLLGLIFSFTFAFVLGIGVASAMHTTPSFASAWAESQGGSGSGALLVIAYTSSLGTFGKFCAVIAALGGIANTIAPTYSSGIDFQLLGRYFARVPRVIWNTVGVAIYTAAALAGRNHLAEIFTNFLALMGYWVAIWFAVAFEEYLFFRGGFRGEGYNWEHWDEKRMLPLGIAAGIAFVVGWVGAVLCMAQVWFVGPLAALVGGFGADMGNYVGFAWGGLVFPGLRWGERRWVGR